MVRSFVFFSMICSPVIASSLEVGDEAPQFRLPGSDGNEYSLEQFLGKKAVVVAWYPKAFTGG